MAGVTVTAYDASGSVGGTATTGANGAYALTPSGAGPYRVEFTGWPATYQPGPLGPDSGSAVQFVADIANAGNVSMGLVIPGDYCQDNPDLATNCYAYGDQINGPNNGRATLVSFPYSAGSDRQPAATGGDYDAPTSHALTMAASMVGTTWGLAYRRSTQTIFAAAYMKRHAGYGPHGPGVIYQLDRATSTATLYTDLTALFGPQSVGSLQHAATGCPQAPATPYACDNGDLGWDAVGKEALGGLAIADDESMLYVMNLFYRTLYAVPLTTPPTAANVRGTALQTPPPGCPSASDVRPFAVQFYQGTIYVGMVCSAESTRNPNDLRAYVYAVDPVDFTFGTAPVFQLALNSPRGGAPAWGPWSPMFASAGAGAGPDIAAPQPLLTDLAFDNGILILGLRDRFGDQGGDGTFTDPAQARQFRAIPAGDTIRACGTPASGWTAESSGGCGGPGRVARDGHSLGGLAQIPGYPAVAATAYEPVPAPSSAGASVDGGIRWIATGSGDLLKSYRIYGGAATAGAAFGAANGLGDLIALCDAAPIEIGSRVWRDANSNGLQDAGEPGLAGVAVRLYAPSGALLGAAVTDGNGVFSFSSGPGTNIGSALYRIGGLVPHAPGYTLAADNGANFAAGGVLAGYTPAQTRAGDGGQDARDSDATVFKGIATIAFATGGPGANNHNLDFGFVPGTPPTPQPGPAPQPQTPKPSSNPPGQPGTGAGSGKGRGR